MTENRQKMKKATIIIENRQKIDGVWIRDPDLVLFLDQDPV